MKLKKLLKEYGFGYYQLVVEGNRFDVQFHNSVDDLGGEFKDYYITMFSTKVDSGKYGAYLVVWLTRKKVKV